ncbi:MAG: hypothetical protein FWC41_02410 [Firmicutes bacterium]|nr:hypothetical protein [Bacillota bacterium]
MYNITLLCTRHEEAGLCTLIELYRIFEAIKPGVIFEEIPPSYFDEYYVAKTRRNLETDTVNKYLENHNIPHILVDSDNVPSDSFFMDLQNMHERIERLRDINGYNYRTSIDKSNDYARMYGFPYLNSIQCIGVQDEIDDAIEKGLQKLNDEKLFLTHKLWKEVIDKRENEMLQNIYTYSKKHVFENAIFMIGSGHRKSIINKISEYEQKSEIKLNWIFSIP